MTPVSKALRCGPCEHRITQFYLLTTHLKHKPAIADSNFALSAAIWRMQSNVTSSDVELVPPPGALDET